MAATPVPPSTTRTPLEYRPKPPSDDLKEPEDYKVKFKVHQVGRFSSTLLCMLGHEEADHTQNHKTVSKVCPALPSYAA